MVKGKPEKYGLVLGLMTVALVSVLGAAAPVKTLPEGHVLSANPPADTTLAPPVARPAGTGGASYYGRKFAGHPTASGETFDPQELTAAHRSLPFGTRVRVTNLRNGETVVVRINDRGPFVPHRIIDVSRAAARHLGMIRRGKTRVRLEVLGSGMDE